MKSAAVQSLVRLARSSPGQSFVIFPVLVIAFEAVRRRGLPRTDVRFLPLLAWGYLQYRLCGNYRRALGGGGRGMEPPPDRLVTSGPYALSRNPMYVGHMLFTLGLALVFRSPLGVILLVERACRFGRRVRVDEHRLEQIFGDEYRDYRRRVKRWIPGLSLRRQAKRLAMAAESRS